MKRPWRLLIVIIILTLLAGWVSLPKNASIRIPGPKPFTIPISAPSFDINLGTFRFARDGNLHFGLDLQGGTHLVLEANMKDIPKADRADALESVRSIMDRRVNFYGVSEPVIQTAKVGESYRLIVELPGVKNIDEAVNLVGKTAQLSFHEVDESTSSAEIASLSGKIMRFKQETELTGKDLKKSTVQFDPNTGQPEVGLEFTDRGGKVFEEITKRNIGKPIAIFLDNQIISTPVVNTVISGGKGVIQGSFTVDGAKELSVALNAGALPVPVTIIEQRNIGATIGEKAVHNSLYAGILGLSVVALFMIALYGKRGILADIALLVYAALVLAIFKLIPVTLTLAGIAGFILSIGMAVDANILIFERIKEELKSGKSIATATEFGFDRAFPSIRDSNMSSLITCFILYWFGTGLIRGFAFTLAIGILVSLFSSITVTRTLLRIFHK